MTFDLFGGTGTCSYADYSAQKGVACPNPSSAYFLPPKYELEGSRLAKLSFFSEEDPAPQSRTYNVCTCLYVHVGISISAPSVYFAGWPALFFSPLYGQKCFDVAFDNAQTTHTHVVWLCSWGKH